VDLYGAWFKKSSNSLCSVNRPPPTTHSEDDDDDDDVGVGAQSTLGGKTF